MRLLLGVVVAVALVAALAVVRTDLARTDGGARSRVEAVVPLVGLLVLLWWVWVAQR